MAKRWRDCIEPCVESSGVGAVPITYQVQPHTSCREHDLSKTVGQHSEVNIGRGREELAYFACDTGNITQSGILRNARTACTQSAAPTQNAYNTRKQKIL